jgi:hypothetical protein
MNKYSQILLSLSILLTVFSCSSPLDKPLGAEGLEAATQEINSDNELTEMQKKYVVDNLSMMVGFMELGKAMTGKKVKDTFRGEFDRLSSDYDSIKNAKIEAKETNLRLENFTNLVDAEATPIDNYNGYLTMSIDFNNAFDKEVLYIIMNYQYVDKYDTKYFEENVKVTDEVAGTFDSLTELTTSEKYNQAASFLYSKVPTRARKALIDELGEKVANKKVMSDFLLEGLKIKVNLVVFKDKTELAYKDAEWEYMDN